MWTYASLEAESEGLVEHTLSPFPLPPPLPKESIFQCCSLVEERKRWQECPGDPPRMLSYLWTKMDHVPFGVRDRNKYCVLL